MANISFGVNILPKTSSVTIGNSEAPWRIHTNQINGHSTEDVLLPEVSSTDNNKILKVVNGSWSVVSQSSSSYINPSFSIATSAWTAVTGGYSATITNSAINDYSYEHVTFDNSLEEIYGNINITKNASNHSLVFTVSIIPADTISGNILILSGDIATTYSSFVGATTQANGSTGLVPAPLIADKDKYLKGDGTWKDTVAYIDIVVDTQYVGVTGRIPTINADNFIGICAFDSLSTPLTVFPYVDNGHINARIIDVTTLQGSSSTSVTLRVWYRV